MKTSLSVWSLHQSMFAKEMDNAAFIEFAAAAGVEGVELLSVFWNDDGGEIGRIRDALARTNLTMACFGACNNLCVSDADERTRQLADITSSVDRAVTFGARVVRVFSGDKTGDVSYEQASDWIIDGLKEASAYAASQGVTLCLENHGLFAGKAEQVLNVIREVGSEHLRSTFDTGNFLLVDESPSEAAVKLADHISHVHLKDFALVEQDYEGKIYTSLSGQRYAGFAPGEGSVDLPFILGHLKDNGYNGWLTVEYEGDEEQKQGSERSILNLRRMLSAL